MSNKIISTAWHVFYKMRSLSAVDKDNGRLESSERQSSLLMDTSTPNRRVDAFSTSQVAGRIRG